MVSLHEVEPGSFGCGSHDRAVFYIETAYCHNAAFAEGGSVGCDVGGDYIAVDICQQVISSGLGGKQLGVALAHVNDTGL